MNHREEREFTLRLEVAREFKDDYEGEEDGFVWAEEIPGLASELVRACVELGQRHGWRVRPRNRGRPAEDEITLVLEKGPD
jgi:hypothetical protein